MTESEEYRGLRDYDYDSQESEEFCKKYRQEKYSMYEKVIDPTICDGWEKMVEFDYGGYYDLLNSSTF